MSCMWTASLSMWCHSMLHLYIWIHIPCHSCTIHLACTYQQVIGFELWNNVCFNIVTPLLETQLLLIRATSFANECKHQRLLSEESIREIATNDCCVHRYCQLFLRDKMKAIRKEMWLGDPPKNLMFVGWYMWTRQVARSSPLKT